MAQTKERRKQFKNISFEIPMELYEVYLPVIQKQNKTLSEFMREALAKHIEEAA